MTVHAPSIGPGTLTIGAETMLTDFSDQCKSAKIIPKVDKGDPINVLSGKSVPGDRTETHTLEVDLQSDFGVTASKYEWLWEHRGETHDFIYIPTGALGRRITGQLVVEPIEIGGEVKTKPSATVTFDLVGAPIFDNPVGG